MKAAAAQRLGLIKYDTDYETYILLDGPPIQSLHLTVTDSGIKNAMWGPGKVPETDEQMKTIGLKPHGDYKDGGSRVWHTNQSFGERGSRSGLAFDVYSKYKKYIEDNVAADVKVAREDTISSIREALIPYIADLRTPLAPDNPNLQVKVVHSPAQDNPEKLELNLVQYGFSYINARGTESEVHWHVATPLSLSVGAGGKKDVPTGATVTVPKDPNNLKAEQLATKAKPIDDLSKQLEPIEPKSVTKPLPTSLPTYVSAFRQVYRRFWTSAEQVKTKQPAVPEAVVKKMGNLEGEELVDSWDPKLVVTGKV